MVKEIGCRLVGEVVVPSPHQGERELSFEGVKA
jgi:hypothetical protein